MSKFESLDSLERDSFLIRCPVCGQEYLPAELFLPSDLLGNPKDIVKRNDGKIDFYLGEKPTYETEYVCDNCCSHFKVKAKLFFETTTNDEDNFDAEYESKLKVNLLSEVVDLFNDNPTESK